MDGLQKLVENYIDIDDEGEEAFQDKKRIAVAILNAYWNEKDDFVSDAIYKYLGQVILSPEETPLEIRKEIQDEVVDMYFNSYEIGDNTLRNKAGMLLEDKKFLSIAVLLDKIIFESKFFPSAQEFLTKINGFSKSKKICEIILALDDLLGLEQCWDEFIEEQGMADKEGKNFFTLSTLMLYREIGAILDGEESIILDSQEATEVRDALWKLITQDIDDEGFEILRDFVATAVSVVWEEELSARRHKEGRFGLVINYHFQDGDTYEYMKLLLNILGIDEIPNLFSSRRGFLTPLQAHSDSGLVMFGGLQELNLLNEHSIINFAFQFSSPGDKSSNSLGWYLAGIAPPLYIQRVSPFILGVREKETVFYFLPLREEFLPYITFALPTLLGYSGDEVDEVLQNIFSRFSVTRDDVEEYLRERKFEGTISPQDVQFFMEILNLLPWEEGRLSLDKLLNIPCIGEQVLGENLSRMIMAGMLVMETIKSRYRRENKSFAEELISALGL
ncbi:MAG TPA: hypothetical protein ENF97_00895 [Candidatus Omnitrophica bacterium]|nr:hypothetical protein [Candidatus Omnitrophota bacterium]